MKLYITFWALLILSNVHLVQGNSDATNTIFGVAWLLFAIFTLIVQISGNNE